MDHILRVATESCENRAVSGVYSQNQVGAHYEGISFYTTRIINRITTLLLQTELPPESQL